jgi:phytoene dehydrogenase-like protein
VPYREKAIATPAVESFMHLHLGIRGDGLEHLTGHHVVVHSSEKDITVPGNTCMISIPSVWDANLAPADHHVVHAYTWNLLQAGSVDASYEHHKQEKLKLSSRFRTSHSRSARSHVLELIGTPLTHARYLRRHQGTYGPAIAAGEGMFPGPQTPIAGLYRVGDSTSLALVFLL